MITKFVVSRDDSVYEAWPDVTMTESGRLVCVFNECTHHLDKSYTRIMFCVSDDRGRTWSPKRPLTEALHGGYPNTGQWWNLVRVATLSDGRLVSVANRIARGAADYWRVGGEQSNWLWFSGDEGDTWDGPHETPVYGVNPDQLIELKQGPHAGRWILSAQTSLRTQNGSLWTWRHWFSDDQGKNWTGPQTIAAVPGLCLCEGSMLELPGGQLVCFMRENSSWSQVVDAFKSISLDGGLTWEEPGRMAIPACIHPVAGMLQSGRVLVTYRHQQGGKGTTGWLQQNFFAAVTDVESCLARRREETHTRIMPIDYDRSPESDTGGGSGFIQFPDGEIYIVNYIVDDAPKGQIRGYSLYESDFLIGDWSTIGQIGDRLAEWAKW